MVEKEPPEHVEDVTYRLEIQRGLWGIGDQKAGESGPGGEWEMKKETMQKGIRLAQRRSDQCLQIETLQIEPNSCCTRDTKHLLGEDSLFANNSSSSGNMEKARWLDIGEEDNATEGRIEKDWVLVPTYLPGGGWEDHL